VTAEILLVEDDAAVSELVAANLRAHGYAVRQAASASEATRAWEAGRPDLVILDLGLPDRDGLTVIRRVRSEAATPVVILSARDREMDKVEALDAGADDYLTKPIGMAELQARVRAAIRRGGGPAAAADGRLAAGAIALDPGARRVTVAGVEVHLTPREFELLRVLLTMGGRVATKGRLLRAVWGAAYVEESHYLHVHVASLRRKLDAADPAGKAGARIVALPGVGYRVREAEEDDPGS
jgi:two-component system KDP operon response regulator KdpE